MRHAVGGARPTSDENRRASFRSFATRGPVRVLECRQRLVPGNPGDRFTGACRAMKTSAGPRWSDSVTRRPLSGHRLLSAMRGHQDERCPSRRTGMRSAHLGRCNQSSLHAAEIDLTEVWVGDRRPKRPAPEPRPKQRMMRPGRALSCEIRLAVVPGHATSSLPRGASEPEGVAGSRQARALRNRRSGVSFAGTRSGRELGPFG